MYPLPDRRAFGYWPIDRAEGFGAPDWDGRYFPVYVVTNLDDSEGVFKIGMTRRIEPEAEEYRTTLAMRREAAADVA